MASDFYKTHSAVDDFLFCLLSNSWIEKTEGLEKQLLQCRTRSASPVHNRRFNVVPYLRLPVRPNLPLVGSTEELQGYTRHVRDCIRAFAFSPEAVTEYR
jgi:hypothetical protein